MIRITKPYYFGLLLPLGATWDNNAECWLVESGREAECRAAVDEYERSQKEQYEARRAKEMAERKAEHRRTVAAMRSSGEHDYR